MFALDRHQKIKKMLLKNQHVDVANLSKIFGVSEVTIRRDLDKLESQGFLIKIHGGAVINSKMSNDATVSKNISDPDSLEEQEHIEKKLIGMLANEFVEDNSSVFISAGSINPFIANNIKDKKKLTVITNDMNIAMELMEYTGIKVVLTGGELIEGSSIMAGPRTIEFIKGSYIKTAFIEVEGIDLSFGYTISNYEEALVYNEVLNSAVSAYVVADYTRFGKVAFNKLFPNNTVNNIITNSNIPDEYKKFLFENYVKVFTTYKLEEDYDFDTVLSNGQPKSSNFFNK